MNFFVRIVLRDSDTKNCVFGDLKSVFEYLEKYKKEEINYFYIERIDEI